MEKKKSHKKADRTKEMEIPVSYADETESSHSEESEPIERKELSNEELEYLKQLQRLQAEFDNYRKRINKERTNLFNMAKGELISQVIPVLDDLDRMINYHQESDHQCSVEGVNLIYQKLLKVLNEEGLEEIPSVGEKFNPEVHEAVGVEKTDKKNDDIVLEEWQKGYLFSGKLLRPSRVKVGKYTKEHDKPKNES